MNNDIKIITLTGPSGSGKSKTEKNLVSLKKINTKCGPVDISKVISYTSRPIRNGEVNGIDYHFVSKKFFTENKKDFIELVEFAGNFYGVHKNSIQKGINVIVVEPEGYIQIKDKDIANIFGVYLEVTTDKQIERMLARGDNPEDIEKRLNSDNISKQAKELSWDLKINTCVVTEKEVLEIIVRKAYDFL